MKLTREEMVLMLEIIEEDKTPAAHTWRFDKITNLSNKLKDELKGEMTTEDILKKIQSISCDNCIVNISEESQFNVNPFNAVIIEIVNASKEQAKEIRSLAEKLKCQYKIMETYTADYSSYIEFEYNEREKDLQNYTVSDLIEKRDALRKEIGKINELIK